MQSSVKLKSHYLTPCYVLASSLRFLNSFLLQLSFIFLFCLALLFNTFTLFYLNNTQISNIQMKALLAKVST